MASQEDLAFGQIAVERKFVTAAQVAECLEAQTKDAQLGVFPRSLGEVLMERGLLSQYLVKEIYKAQGRVESFPEIEGYELEARIGHGGMGTVYRARQKSLERVVAIKVLASNLARDRTFVNRFLREARAVAKLNHENIIVGIDVGKSGDHYFFAMEFVDGETVHEILRREKRLDERRALEIVRQVTLALANAHENGLVHRDVKPGNVMVTADGTSKLCDLGLAKSIHQDGSLTQSGTTHGTPHYMSPEQARGAFDIDIRSDIYSLGATLYHMVVGDVPFTGASAAVILLKHLSETVPSPRARRPELTDGTCHLIETMMAKKPAQRYQLPQELLADVDRVIGGHPPRADRPAAGESSVLPAGGTAPSPADPPAHAAAEPVVEARIRRSPLVLAGMAGVGALVMLGALQLFGGGPTVGPANTSSVTAASVTPPSTGPTRPSTAIVPALHDPEKERREREEQLARQFLDQWLAARAKEPDDHASHIEHLRIMVERFKATRVASVIRTHLSGEKRAFNAEAAGRLAGAKASLPRWRRELRYGLAIPAFETVAEDYAGTKAGDEAERIWRRLEEERNDQLMDLAAEAERLERGGELTLAIEAWQKVRRLGLPDQSAHAQVAIRRLGQLIRLRARLANESAQRESRRRWLEYSTDIYERLSIMRAYGDTLTELDAAAEKPRFEPVRDWIRRDRILVSRAKRVYDAAIASLRKQIGRRVRVRLRRIMRLVDGKLLAVQKGELAIRVGQGAKVRVSLVDLAWEDLRNEGFAGNDRGEEKLVEGSLRFCDGEFSEARVSLDQAVRAGEPAEAHANDLRERVAWLAFDRAHGAWLAGDFDRADRGLRRLRNDHAGTQVFKDNADVIREWIARAPGLIDEAEAARRVLTPEARKRLGRFGVEIRPRERQQGPPHIEVEVQRLLLPKIRNPGTYGNPPVLLFEGSATSKPWTRQATGLSGPANTRLVFRPSLRGDMPTYVAVELACTRQLKGTVLTIADALSEDVSGSVPLTVAIEAEGAALVLRELPSSAPPRELIRLQGLKLGDGANHKIAVRLGEGRVTLYVDALAPREAAALSRAPGHVAITGHGESLEYRSISVKGVIDARWVLNDSWLRNQLAR